MSKADKKGRHHLHIELSPAQYQLLTKQSKACGLSKRAYLVRLIEGTPLPVKPSQELKDLRWEVHKIGVNINQIARSVNAGIARAEDVNANLKL
nr:plasmid mobilization relaxosome protein MobC [uncultured Oscillibacter sp.]